MYFEQSDTDYCNVSEGNYTDLAGWEFELNFHCFEPPIPALDHLYFEMEVWWIFVVILRDLCVF